jgi:hypothetical protein
MLHNISVRLGAPSVPNFPLRFSAHIENERQDGDDVMLTIAVRAMTDLGDHATGTILLSLPAGAVP